MAGALKMSASLPEEIPLSLRAFVSECPENE